MTGNVKHIIVIESLTEIDGGNFTGEALYNDIIRRQIDFYERDFTHAFYKIKSIAELIDLLNSYREKAVELKGGILFHIEMHGAENLQGLVLSNGDLATWELLADSFREINIICENKLFVTLGTCFGRFLYKGVDPYKKSPYSGYISASIEVLPQEVYLKFGQLFEDLINRGNIVDAYLEMEKTGSSFFYKDSERIFEEAFNATFEQLRNGLKKQMLEESIEQVEKEFNTKLDSNISSRLFDLTLRQIYLGHKKAFDFNN